MTSLIVLEFWSVATRNAPTGLQMPRTEAKERLDEYRSLLTVLPDTPEVLDEWQEIIVQHSITGTDVYDAYIAATLRVHQIPRLLTFNTADFRRFGPFRVVNPAEVSGSQPAQPADTA